MPESVRKTEKKNGSIGEKTGKDRRRQTRARRGRKRTFKKRTEQKILRKREKGKINKNGGKRTTKNGEY